MTTKNSLQYGKKCSPGNYVILYLSAIFFTICMISAQECFDDGNEFCIDQNDILSVDLLPGSFLFTDQLQNNSASNEITKESMDGSFDKALNKMNYHRKRMNEYLCHGYMAEEIFKEVSTPRVKRRPESSPIKNLHNVLGNNNVTTHDKLLADEGSSKYKNWLQRTTMLDDVYRHYAPHKKIKKKQDVRNEDVEEFDGEVTGYAMQAPLPSGKIGFYDPSHEDDMLSSSTGHHFHSFQYEPTFGHHQGDHFGHHGDFFPAIHEEYYYAPSHHHDQEEDNYHKPSYPKEKSHDLSIRDFFEIALTALAFLAFGLFIIQLLMNATNNGMVVTTRQRSKRHITILPLSLTNNEDLNELSYRVLRSIEAAMVAEADSGNCLRRILCEDNRYSKKTNDGRRIWVPVWSLGMSWLSGRMLHRTPWSAMLDSVKASILGLGGIDCASFYPGCDLQKERFKRRRRRRK